MSNKYYKFLKPGGLPTHGKGVWPLPTKNADGTWTPGEWLEVEGELVPCRNALHAAIESNLRRWVHVEAYEIEYADTPVRHDVEGPEDKVYGRKARLVRKCEGWDIRLYSVECAAHVLPVYEKRYPNDSRVADCIQDIRDFLAGKIGRASLLEARDAAYAAAAYAADAADAAADAAYAADAADAAADAAYAAAAAAAAYAVAYAVAAAGAVAAAVAYAADAAADAAYAAEHKWQNGLILEMLEVGMSGL